MSSYVNLLQDSEIQLRSVTRDKKSLRMGILGIAVLIVFGILLFVRHYLAVTGEAKELTKKWKVLEPQHIKAKEREEILRTAGNRLQELGGWTQARGSAPDLLAQVAALIPAGMQLISLEWQSYLAGVEGDPRMNAAPVGPQATLPLPERRISLLMRGVLTGPESEQGVLNFVESIKTSPFGQDLTHVKLLETGKAIPDKPTPGVAPGKEIAGTRFSVDMQFKPRPLEWKRKN